ncbi:hypothetical protein BpHYR1_030461 [Brachionus plicatilis]|uniref:Retrovirus-related Pol poly from transposon n=1 Tax=Brachionus plicatilis TaxID=10195 RepID=A0A3M7QAQ5_BRAPC|nr:hypothetical protein BpHYR1_030461 [Brachionus plicatilis]
MFTAIGTPTNTVGKTTIKLTQGDQTLDTEVIVIGNLLNDCLIGLETLNKFNVTKDIIEQLIIRLKCTEIKEDQIDNDCTINFMEEREEPINSAILEKLRTKITKEAGDVSAKSLRDLTPTNAIEHEIRLTDNIPFSIKPRPVPFAKRNEFKQLITEMAIKI